MPIKGPYGFIGGWNTKATAFTLPKDQMSDAQDVQIIYGDLMKRKGSKYINVSAISGTPAVHGLFDWLIASGTRYLLVTAGTKLFQSTALGSTLTDITGSVTITSGQDNQHTFASLNNIVAICGGTTPDAPIQWTGTGNASVLAGSPPSGNIVCVANNFMFISGIAATPSRFFWSNPSDPNTWGAGNSLDFRISDGDTITALAEFNQNLIIFKRRSMGQLFTQTLTVSGSVTLGPLTQIASGIGCAGSLCVDHLPDGRLAFLGSNAHMYLYDGTGINDISDQSFPQSNIQPTFDGLNFSRLNRSVVQCYPTRNQIWVSVSNGSSSTNNLILVYDYILNTWQSPFTGIAANVMEATIDTRSTPSHPVVMTTGTYGGFVTEQDTASTNAEQSDGHIDGYGTISVQLAPEEREFIPRSIIIPYEAQVSGQVNYSYGFNGYTSTSKSVVLSQLSAGAQLNTTFILNVSSLGGPLTLRKVVPLVSNANIYSMQMKFENPQAGQDMTVHPVMLTDEVAI